MAASRLPPASNEFDFEDHHKKKKNNHCKRLLVIKLVKNNTYSTSVGIFTPEICKLIISKMAASSYFGYFKIEYSQ